MLERKRPATHMTRPRGKYEVTVNLDFPTTETLDIPTEWIMSHCPNCGNNVYIDEKNGNIHHKEPFCSWWMSIWLDKAQMVIEVQKLLDKTRHIKVLLEKQRH